jgi:hypothetical protein
MCGSMEAVMPMPLSTDGHGHGLALAPGLDPVCPRPPCNFAALLRQVREDLREAHRIGVEVDRPGRQATG